MSIAKPVSKNTEHMTYGTQSLIDQLLIDVPRNDYERAEQKFVKEMWKYVYKDQRSIDAFARLIETYRAEISRLNIMIREFININHDK